MFVYLILDMVCTRLICPYIETEIVGEESLHKMLEIIFLNAIPK